MATHSSILVWEIPWKEEPGGLLSMGCEELDTTEHNLLQPQWETNACLYSHKHLYTYFYSSFNYNSQKLKKTWVSFSG